MECLGYDEYFIQGLVIENMVLRFDDIYHKKYKKNYIKFFGNVIETNNYEDCLLMYNNLYLLENNSLKKQGRQKNKKDNEHFYNSCSIIAKGGAGQKAVNIKLFNNGQITLTGAKKDTDGNVIGGTSVIRIKGEVKAPKTNATPMKPAQGPVNSSE